MRKILSVILSLLIISVSAALSGCGIKNVDSSKGFTLNETPQTYFLSGEDAFMLMPTVTLYENGNAQLSQPMVSSLGMFDLGSYEIKDNEMTVTHGGATVTFTIADGGDTLTIESTDLLYTKIGSVYKYQSNAESLESYKKVDGDKLTIEILRQMAQNAPGIVFSDFDRYAYVERDPGYRIFDIEGRYTLTVIFSAEGQLNCTLMHNISGQSFPLNLNGSTGLVLDEFLGITTVPKFVPQKWFDYYNDIEKRGGERKELTLPEFPGVTFKWDSSKVTANDRDLIFGMPVWNVYLADLTNDGKPELCATVSIGSGIVDTHIIVYDYVTDKTYILEDRMQYDYFLSIDDGTKLIGEGKLLVNRVGYSDHLDYSQYITTELLLINGEIYRP